MAFSTDVALAGRMPGSVIIEYNVTPSKGASIYSTLGETKNVVCSIAICEALGIETPQTATAKAWAKSLFKSLTRTI